jgi:F-type H+-transporting ATPase subunit a
VAAGHSPLSQFEIKRWVPMQIGDLDVSLTNSATFMLLTVFAVSVFLVLGMRGHAMVPGRWQSMVELSYIFIANLVKDTVGTEGRPYFPFIFTVFMFVLVGNLFGMVPYGFTFTSHIIVTFTMAVVVFLGVTVIALLSVRLFANMLAGHTLLKVFAGFVVALGLFGVFPLAFVVALTALEIVIALLQAFVFTILTCLYLNDALHLH